MKDASLKYFIRLPIFDMTFRNEICQSNPNCTENMDNRGAMTSIARPSKRIAEHEHFQSDIPEKIISPERQAPMVL
jgi:hypothetical protein